MATLKRKTVYKNGGASYQREGVRASVYCGPKMFTGGAPESIDIDSPALTEPGAVDTAKVEAKAAKIAAKTAKTEARAAAKKAREDARAAKAAAKANVPTAPTAPEQPTL
jgi:hypothetical protein